MNEKQKKVTVSICFICLVLCIVLQSVVCKYITTRADRQIDALERELVDTRAELENVRAEITDSRRTIGECRNAVRDITDGLGNDNTELKGIIGQLERVREEVEVMEDALSYFYSLYGDDNNSISDSEVKE